MNRVPITAVAAIIIATVASTGAFAQGPPEPPFGVEAGVVAHGGMFGMATASPGHPNPEDFIKFQQLQEQSSQLAKQYITTEKSDEKQNIRKKLADVLNQQFDMHMQRQEKELAALEKEIADLRSLMKKRQDAKAAIVDRRIDQVIQDAEGLGWNASGHFSGDRGFWFNLQRPMPAVPPTPPVTIKR
jgi:hypothetical protein